MYKLSEERTDYTDYIEKNQLEYPILNMLLFNDMGFSFFIMQDPEIRSLNNEFCITVNGENILASQEQFPTFKNMDGLNTFVYHPEHIHGYCARHGERAFGELIYNRKNDSAIILLNEVFSDFYDAAGFDSLEQIQAYMKKCLFKQRHFEKEDKGNLDHEFDDLELIFDDRMAASIEKYGDSVDKVKRKFLFVMYENAKAFHHNRTVSTDGHVYLIYKDRLRVLVFEQQFTSPKPVHTRLTDQIIVISRDDDISNLLFKIAVEITANKLYIATGYMYRSGLEMLKPVFTYISLKENGDVRLTIGALQNYRTDASIKGMNRETANELNRTMNAGLVSSINTYESSFYHGKYYYITNGYVSYLIIGSSNVTETAFLRNLELDVLYRFESSDQAQKRLEEKFLSWYWEFQRGCVSLDNLNPERFESNIFVDESKQGYTGSRTNNLIKKLTTVEEQERYKFLLGFGPTSVESRPFMRKDVRPFKNYSAFLYEERNITVLECFSYGNSSYVFENSNVEEIIQLIANRSKETVKKSDLFISDIRHDDSYQDIVTAIFKAHCKDEE